jgi:Cupin
MICSRVREDLLGGFMDVLSEVLKVVKLQGAMFYNGEFSSPWSLCSPASRSVAPYLAPDAGHVIIYHLLASQHQFRLRELLQYFAGAHYKFVTTIERSAKDAAREKT